MADATLIGPSDTGLEIVAARPLVEQTVRSVIEQRIAVVARQALDGPGHPLIDSEQIARLALDAAHEQLADLTDPPSTT